MIKIFQLLNMQVMLLGLLVIISLYTDIRSNKIKNKIIYPFCALGAVMNIVQGGLRGGLDSFYGFFIPIILLFVLYLMGGLGAGDIKLFSAVGAIMGGDFIIKTILATFIVGGPIALSLMILKGKGRERIKYLIGYIKILFIGNKLIPYTDHKNKEGKFPFAIAISLGVVVTTFLL